MKAERRSYHGEYQKADRASAESSPHCLFRRGRCIHGVKDSRFPREGRAVPEENQLELDAGGNAVSSFFAEHPREFFEMYRKMAEGIAAAKPNKAHEALAALERMGKLTAVVTQNIDGLHQKAGSRNVIELHGTSLTNTCLDCGKNISLDDFLAQKETIPHCPCCGGMLRPDIILYEEALDMDVIDDAATAISQADLLIIGGTSLVVYPAAGMVRYFGGDAKVMINRDPTERDEECDLVFRESIGKVLDEAVRGLTEI